MNLVIVDLDNCIADDQRRIKLIDWSQSDPDKRYEPYHADASRDVIQNFDLFEGKNVAVFTARPEKYREATECWLTECGVRCVFLFMRPEGDHRKSVEVKAHMLLKLKAIAPQPLVIEAAYDDRQDVVNMYKAFGIDAHVVSIHDQCAYTPPVEKRLLARDYNLDELDQDNPHNRTGDTQ